MTAVNWGELFPTRFSGLIFVGYMSLFVAQGILVTASQDDNSQYSYNTVTLVLLTEVLKLVVSAVIYSKQHSFRDLLLAVAKDSKVLLLYCVPAFLYCLYNNLAFVNLSKFDPTSYYLLLQFRVVITGVLFQIIFKKHLTRNQWFSLILLTCGCMVKQIDFNSTSSFSLDTFFNANLVLILIQTVCSCLAGVYNEYLLKRKGASVDIFVANVMMYLDSILFNLFVLGVVEGSLFSAFSGENLRKIAHFKVLIIMVNNAAIGIVTSFFLKYLNSILKTFASALELLFTAILCYILFGIPVYLNTILAIGIVSVAIYLYSQSPVNNTSKEGGGGGKDSIRKAEEGRSLIDAQDEEEDEQTV